MTKRTLLALLLLGLIAMVSAQAQDLFISEYLEGSSNNKALEIYNGTGAAVDLSNYTMKLASNGASSWSTTNSITLSGTLANNDVFVIANAGANAAIQAVADVTSTVTYYNGNDCVGLFNGTTLIDIIGVLGENPGDGLGWPVAGVENATKEYTLVRKPEVVSGNLNFVAGAGTNMDNSEWIVHPQDYIADLGMHTFDPGGGQNAATPTFNPPAGVYGAPINVVLSSETTGAQIRYTTNGSEPTETSTLYTAPIAVSATTTIKAKAWASGMDPSYTATANYLFPVMIPNIAALRAANADGTTVYNIAGEVFLTFQQTFRHQKFIQDASSAILIDDYNGVITTPYNVGDGITGITGTLNRYTTQMLQFWPVINSGPATSTGNSIPTPVLTINEINNNLEMYQSRLVRVNDAHFSAPAGNYATGQSYDLLDATGTILFRTQFFDADYIDTPMHNGTFNLRGIVTQFNTSSQLTPRSLADFNPPVANDDDTAVPVSTQLIGNYPNPFNPSTTIEFFTDKAQPVQLTIYNQKGQAVKTWNLEGVDKGRQSVAWDGIDDNGSSVSSGVYFYRMLSGKYSSTRKMVLMK